WALDQTKTGMGSRTLRKWLLKPLYSVPAIKERQQSVRELIDNDERRQSIAQALSSLSDLERLGVKLSSGTILPKELVAVQQSIESRPGLAGALKGCSSRYLSVLSEISPALAELRDTIASSLSEDAPRELTEGGIFRAGYSPELDEVRALLGGGKQW